MAKEDEKISLENANEWPSQDLADFDDQEAGSSGTGSSEVARGNWSGRMDFFMTMLAYCVGLGNVWRFPYLCYKNGGGAFLLPYAMCWAVMAVPMFFLEVAIGQYSQRGGLQLWDLCPMFKGVGIATIFMSTYCNMYYCVIIVWALFYLFSSFQSQLPWMSCGNFWNDHRCYDERMMNQTNGTEYGNETTAHLINAVSGVASSVMSNVTDDAADRQTPVEQFWLNRVLRTSDDISSGGEFVWELTLLLILVWCLSYFALWKGITKMKKMIYACALFPYLVLSILTIRAATLPGAANGVYYYLKPNLTKLTETTVWKDAGTQVFYSYGIGFGVLTAMGSYNKFNHNCLKDTLIICCINGGTSFVAGCVVFSVLGYMAHVAKKTVADVVQSGVGLVFLVYPEAVGNMRAPQLWAVLFFLMVIVLGLDTQVCNIEGVITALSDISPHFRKYKKQFVLVMCVFCFTMGLPFTTRAGQHWVALVDAFGASGFVLLFIVFFQAIGFAYGYGIANVFKSLEEMLGYRPSRIWLYAWKYATPGAIVVIFLFISVKYEPLKYSDDRPFDVWAQAIGFLITASSMICVPIWATYCIAVQPGDDMRTRIRSALLPQISPRKDVEVESTPELEGTELQCVTLKSDMD